MSRTRVYVVSLVLGLASATTGVAAVASSGVPKVDIDKDGYADVLIGGVTDAFVRLSDGNGGSDGTLSPIAVPDFFFPVGGIAACDFNGDGFTDVAVADYLYSSSSTTGGAVLVKYGSAGGLTGSTVITQDTAGVPGAGEALDEFGWSLACGRIGSDTKYADLLVGAPGEDIGSAEDAGAVTALLGSASGLTGTGSFAISQDSAGVAGTPELYDDFGREVAIGDVTGDGLSELVVIARGENGVGLLHSFKGSSTGWTSSGSTTVSPGSVGLYALGYSLALGRFDGSGALDVAVGGFGSTSLGGAVAVLTARADNLSGSASKILEQDTSGVPGADESIDRFGWRVGAGDVTGDGRDDLLVGVPGEAVGTLSWAGAAVLLKGSSTGLTGTGAQAFTQDSAGVPGAAETYDEFGGGVAVADYNGDGKGDALIGAPSESIGSYTYAGSVTILPGTSAGLTTTGVVSLTGAAFGVPTTSQFGEVIR